MTLRHDVVLVVLPPQSGDTTESGVLLAPALPPPATSGRVWKVGPSCTEVVPGDYVAFPASVGEPVELARHPCLFLRESQISAVIPKRQGAA